MKNITPQILQYFEEICSIPRESKKEEKICSYIREFADTHHLQHREDEAGNIVICKPATAGNEDKPVVVLQSHVDMVCEKDSGVKHDFDRDAIVHYIDGEWMKARGTTLGADNGIGVAAMLAILADRDIPHIPIEALFTVDEETGLTGAKALHDDFITGKILINLDSEDEGELFIGCAGGIDTIATLRYEKNDAPKNVVAYKLTISGLKGGHSGDDINKRRGNAIKILNNILLTCSSMYGISMSRFEGGNIRNAIPREATATVLIDNNYSNDFEQYCINEALVWKEALLSTSPEFQFTVKRCKAPAMIMDIVSQSCLMNVLEMCPSGVVEISDTMHGLVSTSTNIASVKFSGKEKIVIVTSQRSDSEDRKASINNHVRKTFEMMGAKTECKNSYPGWTPNLQSPILETVKAAYEELFGVTPAVRAIHAGLECGLFFEKYPELDMISFGPTIKNVHSPSEKLHIPSVKKFSDLLLKVLNEIK